MPDGLSQRSLSSRIFMLAVVTSVLMVVGGSAILLTVYRDYFPLPATEAAASSMFEGPPLVIGVERTPGGPGAWYAYASAFASVERELGQRVIMRYALDGATVGALFESGALDVAMVSVNTFLDLEQSKEATLLAEPIIAGEHSDAAVMVVSADSDMHSLAELKGSRVALSAGSVASDGFARWLLAQEGHELESFFGSVEYGRSQDGNLALVSSGQADVTCVRRSALAAWSEHTFRVIAVSPEFGMPPVVARSGISDDRLDVVRTALLTGSRAAGARNAGLIDGFTAVEESDYEFPALLREMVADPASVDEGPVE